MVYGRSTSKIFPPYGISDYHVTIWTVAPCCQPPFPSRLHAQVTLKACHLQEKGAKLCKTNLYGISKGSNLKQRYSTNVKLETLWNDQWIGV